MFKQLFSAQLCLMLLAISEVKMDRDSPWDVDYNRRNVEYTAPDTSTPLVLMIIILIIVVLLCAGLAVGIWLCVSCCCGSDKEKENKAQLKGKDDRNTRKKKRRREKTDDSDENSVAVSTTRRSRLDRYRRGRSSRSLRHGSRDNRRSRDRRGSKEQSRHSRSSLRSSRSRERGSRRSSHNDRHRSEDLSRSGHSRRRRSSELSTRSSGSRRRSHDRSSRSPESRHRSRESNRHSPDRSHRSHHSHDSRRKSHRLSSDKPRNSGERRSSRRDNDRHADDSRKQRKSAEKKRSHYEASNRVRKPKDDQGKASVDQQEHKQNPMLPPTVQPQPVQGAAPIVTDAPLRDSQPGGNQQTHAGQIVITPDRLGIPLETEMQTPLKTSLKPSPGPPISEESSSVEETIRHVAPSQQLSIRAPVVPGAPPLAAHQGRLPPGIAMSAKPTPESESEESSESSPSGPIPGTQFQQQGISQHPVPFKGPVRQSMPQTALMHPNQQQTFANWNAQPPRLRPNTITTSVPRAAMQPNVQQARSAQQPRMVSPLSFPPGQGPQQQAAQFGAQLPEESSSE